MGKGKGQSGLGYVISVLQKFTEAFYRKKKKIYKFSHRRPNEKKNNKKYKFCHRRPTEKKIENISFVIGVL